MNHTPPRWAEALLRALLPPRDREPVSGDLLEQYRDSVRTARGRLGAEAWYLTQVALLAWREARLAVLLLLLSAFIRMSVRGSESGIAGTIGPPWIVLVPPAAVLLLSGWRAAWRTSSIWSATAAGFLASLLVTKVLLGVLIITSLRAWPPSMWLGVTWQSLGQLALMLLSGTLVGTSVATIGGLAGVATRLSLRAR